MGKIYELIDKEYFAEEDIEVKVTEILEAPVIEQTISISNIKQKIAILEERKATVIAEIDAEIAEYNEILASANTIAATVTLATPVVEEATSTPEEI